MAIGLLVLGLSAGLLLQISRRSAPVGKSIIWYSSAALLPAIICSGVGALPLGQVLGLVFGDVGVLFGLWAAGPIGLLAGLIWAWRYPGVQRPLFATPIIWWIVGVLVLVLLLVGFWLGGQITDTGQPMKKQAIPPPQKTVEKGSGVFFRPPAIDKKEPIIGGLKKTPDPLARKLLLECRG